MMDRLRDLALSYSKTHHLVLLAAAVCFVRVCWHHPESSVIMATGGTLATLYGANAWAGKPQGTPDAPKV